MRPSTVHRAPAPLMVSEQQTFLSKVATGALASAVALQLAQPVPVAALTPVDAASLAAKEARAEVEAAEAEAAKAQAEAAAASAAQKAFESSLAANKPFESSLDLGYDAAYAAAITKARAEAGLTMAAPASTDSEASAGLSGVDGKVVILPLVAGLALLSVNEASKSSGMGSDWFKLSSLRKPFADGAPPGRGAAAGGQRSAPDILFGGLGNLGKDPLGWCFGPPSALYSNAGSVPAAGPPVAGPPAAGFPPPTAGGGASPAYPYAAEPAPAPEPTRDVEEEAAKAAWLAKQGWSKSGQ